MRLSDHQAAFTADVARLIRMVRMMHRDYRVRLDYAKRSVEEQQRLIDAGISTISRAENSQHVKGLAVDLILDAKENNGWEWVQDGDKYRFLGARWEAMSLWNRWGGRWGDGNHFERLERVRDEPPVYA